MRIKQLTAEQARTGTWMLAGVLVAVSGGAVCYIVAGAFGIRWLWIVFAAWLAGMAVLARPVDTEGQTAVWLPVPLFIMASNLYGSLCVFMPAALVFLGLIVRAWGHAIRDDDGGRIE
jgi:hypothetical protein